MKTLSNSKNQFVIQNVTSKLAAFIVINSVIATQVLFALLWFSEYSRVFAILYLAFIFFDTRWKTGGAKSQRFRKSVIWKYFSEYFPLKIIKEKDLDSHKSYIFGYHPHGVISLGAILALGSDGAGFSTLFPGIVNRLGTLATNFYLPFHREITLRLGFISCSKDSLTKAIENGDSCTLVVGGAREVVYTGKSKIYLNNRKGFVKLAIQTGADLVPVYCFGENSLFSQSIFGKDTIIRKIQETIKKTTGYFFPVISGTGMFLKSGNLPYQIPLTVVVGAPIETEKILAPTEKQIQAVHKKYTDALLDLYNRNKALYGINEENSELEIV